MQKEIIINAEKSQTRIALIENGELVELYIEDPENERTLGDIYLGRVRRTMSSIQAAFIDIGQKQDAFLHFSDLADNLPEWLEFLEQESPSIQQSVEKGVRTASTWLAQRRRPRGQRITSERGDEELDFGDAEEGMDEPISEAGATDDEANEGKPRARVDVRARGRRRSAQQRARHRSDMPDAQERPRGRRRDDRDTSEPDAIEPEAVVTEAVVEPSPADEGIPPLPAEGNGAPEMTLPGGMSAPPAEKSGRSGRNGRGSREDRRPAEKKNLSPEALLKRDRPILVKIVKEPISAKGSRVSTDISLAGRFLVLVPMANYVAVSKKIYSYKERRRLRALAKSLLPEGFGVIVRTVAEGKKAKELDTDLRLLLDKWRKLEKRLQGSPNPPLIVHEDVNMASSVIRDLFSDDYDRILIDDPKLHRNVKNYVQAIAPHMAPAVHLHKGKKHVFQEARIAREVQQAFESRVDLPSGGYLFIEHTEAMYVIDVNSGRAGRGLSQEDNSLKVDLEAVQVIARQIRLRDLGGIIVVDFIDLRLDKNRKKVFNELRRAFRKDRAVTKVLPMSDFGLVEITRQRLRPSITKTFAPSAGMVGPAAEPGASPLPLTGLESADPAGQIERDNPLPMDVASFVEKVERWIKKYREKKQGGGVWLHVHPFTAAYLTRGWPSIQWRWRFTYWINLRVVADEKMAPFRYRFVDPSTGKPFRNDRRRGGRRRGEDRRGGERADDERIDDTPHVEESGPAIVD